jgi:hypothetical protein
MDSIYAYDVNVEVFRESFDGDALPDIRRDSVAEDYLAPLCPLYLCQFVHA